MKSETVFHTIAPVWNENSKILILGSIPSPKSRDTGFYYGHPRNRFWSVTAGLLGEPVPQSNDEKREMLLSHGIALWDVVGKCDIVGASDNSIKNVVYNDVAKLTSASRIKAVFLTGNTAYSLYKKGLAEKVGLPYFGLPSTSPANAAMKEETLFEKYKIILEYIR